MWAGVGESLRSTDLGGNGQDAPALASLKPAAPA
jgi:hypothetical protein